MSAEILTPTHPPGVAETLVHTLFRSHPAEAALWLHEHPASEIAAVLSQIELRVAVPVWEMLAADVRGVVLQALAETRAVELLVAAQPFFAAGALRRCPEPTRARYLETLPADAGQDLRALLAYPGHAAGALMVPMFLAFRPNDDVQSTLTRIRQHPDRARRSVLVLDDSHRPIGTVSLQSLATADPDQRLDKLATPVLTTVLDLDSAEAVAETLELHRLTKLPVVDFDGRLVGVIREEGVVEALRKTGGLDMQTMVGAGRDERALSPFFLAVKKRLMWLEINLVTAFLAASVVGIFEDTIARFTALAVLLPVVAGQSGNAGAQALAVTMRGLAVREVTVRQWPRLALKEMMAGLVNGAAVGVTCAIAVGIWSGSPGLALVIGVSMVLAMVSAGLSGAIIPVALVRAGMDPAQSSSIILTTVTDVVGFFSFLGIATALSSII